MNTFNILQWNVHSLPARFTSLQHLLVFPNCSIALISETWLLSSRTFNLPYFNLFICNRPDGYGGAAIAIHSSLNFRLIFINPIIEQCFAFINPLNAQLNLVETEF